MTTEITVEDDGGISITCDGITYPPLPVEAIEAAAARLDDARNATARQTLTFAVRTLTDVLLTQGPDMHATVTVDPTGLSAVVDAGTYASMRSQMALTPDLAGALVWGPATVTTPPVQPPPVEPPPDPVPDPVPDPAPDPAPTP